MNDPRTRLSSWKEIARYLERDERTVQRWNSERGMPVHRTPGGKRGSVFAFAGELDAWLQNGSAESVAVMELEAAPREEAAEPSDVVPFDTPRRQESASWTIARVLRSPLRLATTLLLVSAMIVGFAILAAYRAGVARHETVQRLTFRQGSVRGARFGPNGRVFYSAAWDGEPAEVFEVAPERPESMPLGAKARLLAVSPESMLALQLNPRSASAFFQFGQLALRAAYGGGLQEIGGADVIAADWSADGSSLFYVTLDSKGSTIETYAVREHQKRKIYPNSGELSGAPSSLRVSPDGRYVAFEEHELGRDDGRVVVVNVASGNVKVTSQQYASVDGVAWSQSGDEVWFTAAGKGVARGIHAIDLRGRERLVFQSTAALTLYDIGSDGTVLVSRDDEQATVFVATADNPGSARELSWFDWTILGDVSADGKKVVFSESGDSVRKPQVFVRDTASGPARLLGDAMTPMSMSPDGRSVLAVTSDACPRVVLFAPDVTSKLVSPENLCVARIFWVDNERFGFSAGPIDKPLRCYTATPSTAPIAVSPEGYTCMLHGPDPKHVLAKKGPQFFSVSIDGSNQQQPIPFDPLYRPVHWRDATHLSGFRSMAPFDFAVFDLRTGQKQARPSPRMPGVENLLLAREDDSGRTVGYSAFRLFSELYLIRGLK